MNVTGRIGCGVVALCFAATSLARGQAPATPTAEELAARLQNRYDTVRDFSAEFVHTYEGAVLRKTLTERGMVQIKKPGKMRWEYTTPEEKLFVSDGIKIYSYIPADRQVIVSSMPSEDQATTAVLFLTGKGSLVRDFTASYVDTAPAAADAYVLKLVPNQRDRDYDWLVLTVDRRTLQLTGLTAADQQGGTSSFVFSKLKENVGLTDKIFTFRIPRNVDVITNGSNSG